MAKGTAHIILFVWIPIVWQIITREDLMRERKCEEFQDKDKNAKNAKTRKALPQVFRNGVSMATGGRLL
jgi:hypothetical protein